MRFRYEKICLDHVDLKNTTFKISTDKPVDDLIHSVKNLGLLTPPILKKNNSQYIIISGFRRILACREIGDESVDSLVVDNKTSKLEGIKLSISDNVNSRSLNLIEQANAVIKLTPFYLDDDVSLCHDANQLGMQLNPGLVRKLRQLESLGETIRNKIASGVISLNIGTELVKIDILSATLIADFFDDLKPTVNHQKEIFTQLKEVGIIKDKTIASLLKSKSINSILTDDNLNRNQKISQLRLQLKKMRFPEICRLEEKYTNFIQRFNLSNKINLTPPEHFEGDQYRVNFMFHNMNEYESCFQSLNNLMIHPDFQKLINKDFADN